VAVNTLEASGWRFLGFALCLAFYVVVEDHLLLGHFEMVWRRMIELCKDSEYFFKYELFLLIFSTCLLNKIMLDLHLNLNLN
jgi:hypothetical protein